MNRRKPDPLVIPQGTANRPVGPFGFFQTGPHRTVREVIEDYWDLASWAWGRYVKRQP